MAAAEGKKPTGGSGQFTVKNLYLIVYNASLVYGWGRILWTTLNMLAQDRNTEQVYAANKDLLIPVQTVAIMEFVHALFGIVRTNAFSTLLQVVSRLYIVWGILVLNPQVQTDFFVKPLIIAWCLAEIIRYAFFVAKQVDVIPYPLLWLRYNAFIILYPLGTASEIALSIKALPYLKVLVEETLFLTLRMPNSLNFAFDFYVLMRSCIFCYLPGFPFLYSHMLAQRKKILSKSKSE